MPYGRSRLTASAQLGDPFLGGLVRGIGRAVGGFVRGGPLGALGAVIGGRPQPQALPPPQILVPRPPGRQIGLLNIQRGGGATAATRGAPRMPGEPGRRRRMNPLNVKAVRRSTRRLAAFQREAKKVEKQLRKIAPQRRSSSRRDLGPGHRHVR